MIIYKSYVLGITPIALLEAVDVSVKAKIYDGWLATGELAILCVVCCACTGAIVGAIGACCRKHFGRKKIS
jgi:hypothetical protein